MDIKNCYNCGNELPKEANFCPYCMTKLIREDGTEIPPSPKKKYKKYGIIIGVLAFLIIAEIIAIVVFSGNDTQVENYSDYLGVWIDNKHQETEQPYFSNLYSTGGQLIEICKVDGDEIVFNIENFSAGGVIGERAYLEYIRVKLINGKGNFSFSDDGYGNSGMGEIKLANGSISARVELANDYVGGIWDLSMDADFTHVEEYAIGQEIDIDGCLKEYIGQKVKFGNRTEIQKYGDSITYTHEGGIDVSVEDIYDIGDLYITDIDIEYDRLHGEYSYSYKGLDNSSTKEDVQELFGLQKNKAQDDFYYFRNDDEETIIEFYFDDNDYIEQIRYSIWY